MVSLRSETQREDDVITDGHRVTGHSLLSLGAQILGSRHETLKLRKWRGRDECDRHCGKDPTRTGELIILGMGVVTGAKMMNLVFSSSAV